MSCLIASAQSAQSVRDENFRLEFSRNDIPRPCITRVNLSRTESVRKVSSLSSSPNVSDFYSVNPAKRLDRIGIEVGRYEEKLISLRAELL